MGIVSDSSQTTVCSLGALQATVSKLLAYCVLSSGQLSLLPLVLQDESLG